MELNGKKVLDRAQLPGVPESGPIGLQHHGGFNKKTGTLSPASSLMQFNDIYVKKLEGNLCLSWPELSLQPSDSQPLAENQAFPSWSLGTMCALAVSCQEGALHVPGIWRDHDAGSAARRLAVPAGLPGPLDVAFGGGEANVCASLALLGQPVRFLTALPKHAIADALAGHAARAGHRHRSRPPPRRGRLGIYFLETGANQRSSKVIYDRARQRREPGRARGVRLRGRPGRRHPRARHRHHARAQRERLPGHAGTGPAGRPGRGATVSCDLNFRKKLWRWQPGHRAPNARPASACAKSSPCRPGRSATRKTPKTCWASRPRARRSKRARSTPAAYETVARQIHERFPNVSQVAITLRESISASHNNWGAMLFDAKADQAYFAPLDAAGRLPPLRDPQHRRPRRRRRFVRRRPDLRPRLAKSYADPAGRIRFAVAASCLKHSIPGDLNYATVGEIEALAAGQASGRVQR